MSIHESNHSKESLLESISELFLTYGLRSTSMEDICVHLKISKKTLYQFFANKDDVVEQVMYYRLEKRRVENAPGELTKMNPVVFLYNVKNHILYDLTTQIPANYFDLKKYHPEVDKKIQKEESEFLSGVIKTVLAKGEEEGYLRKGINSELQLYLLAKQLSFLREQKMLNAIEYPASLLISTIFDNFILALATAKGIQIFEEIKKNEKSNNSESRKEKK